MEQGLSLWMKRIGLWAKRTAKSMKLFAINRNIFGFLVFLCIAIVFWFSMTFKDHTTIEADFALEIVNVPKNVIYTSDVPEKVTVTLNGRGFTLLQYMMQKRERRLRVEYSDLVKVGGVITIDNYMWRKTIAKELPAGINYTTITPSNVEIYYSTGDHKQVPVVFNGKIHTTEQHILCGVNLQPQYVDIYAPAPQFDTITAVYTQPLNLNDAADTITVNMPLQPIKGVKMVPDTVSIQACIDLLTTKTVKVPIYCENIPHNKTLRTFPMAVDVNFQVSATMFNTITAQDFIVVVDYNNISPTDTKCRLIMRQVPEGIFNVKVNPAMVDYVIEQDEN